MTLATHLTTLETSGLIRLAQAEPDLEYLFRHALIQDAAYKSILKTDRKTLHRRIAEALEQLYPTQRDALALLLGQHWREAGEVDRASVYFTRAGEAAQKQYANHEAIAAYTEALALTSHNAQRFDLLANRVAVYDLVADRVKQRADVEAMLVLADALNADARRCDAWLALASFYLTTNFEGTFEPARHALELAQTTGDRVREAQALKRLGIAYWQTFDFPASREMLATAAAHFHQAALVEEAVDCLNALALTLRYQGDLPAAFATLDEALALSRQVGYPRGEATSQRRFAMIYNDQLRPTEALPAAETALALHRKLGDRAEECSDLQMLASVLGDLGQWEQAEAYIHQSIELSWAIGYNDSIWRGLNHLFNLYWPQGRHAELLAASEALLERARIVKNAPMVVFARSYIALCLGVFGRYTQAVTEAQAIQPALEEYFGTTWSLIVAASEGLWLAQLGERSQSRACLDHAYECARQARFPANTLTVLSNMGRWALLEGDAASLHHGLELTQQAIDGLTNSNWPQELTEALDVAAQLLLALNRVEQALTYSKECLRVSATLSSPVAPEQYFYTHARALSANGREAEADHYLQKAYDRVMLVASKTHDPDLRRSWLENVRDNREIVQEWEARQ